MEVKSFVEILNEQKLTEARENMYGEIPSVGDKIDINKSVKYLSNQSGDHIVLLRKFPSTEKKKDQFVIFKTDKGFKVIGSEGTHPSKIKFDQFASSRGYVVTGKTFE